jgi:hypothetical protein
VIVRTGGGIAAAGGAGVDTPIARIFMGELRRSMARAGGSARATSANVETFFALPLDILVRLSAHSSKCFFFTMQDTSITNVDQALEHTLSDETVHAVQSARDAKTVVSRFQESDVLMLDVKKKQCIVIL